MRKALGRRMKRELMEGERERLSKANAVRVCIIRQQPAGHAQFKGAPPTPSVLQPSPHTISDQGMMTCACMVDTHVNILCEY